MKRRDFFNYGILTAIGGTVSSSALISCSSSPKNINVKGKTRNIIFLVSDGMSEGTLNMADLLLQRKEGHGSNWVNLFRENKARRSWMDTASANSLVTDSAAASSSWGGGFRVNNGSLNITPDGTFQKPILQKFKEAGKAVGCVTTVPITHATPAGFCISQKNRGNQARIAELYLPLHFDVMMGGGTENFSKEKRKDGRDLFAEFQKEGYSVAQNKAEMASAGTEKPLLGVFYEEGLPYSVDQKEDEKMIAEVPTLAEMTQKAIDHMSQNPNGFVLQVEGGKVDWAAHGNDTVALLYDQIAFDQAVGVALDFAAKREDTLVIVTADHGNANPGLIGSKNVNQKFDLLQNARYSNEWVLKSIRKTDSPEHLIEMLNHAQGYAITKDEAKEILSHYADLSNDGLYNDYKLPYRQLAQIQQNYTSIGWSGMNHSADFVELTMFGQGSELLKPFVKNIELHNFMLEAAGVDALAVYPAS